MMQHIPDLNAIIIAKTSDVSELDYCVVEIEIRCRAIVVRVA